MLESFARHGGFDLEVETKGDLHIDMHHTVEDTGIVIGQALHQALDGFKGMRRFGARLHPDGRDADALRHRPVQPALSDLAGGLLRARRSARWTPSCSRNSTTPSP